MKAVPQVQVLRDALVSIRETIDESGATAPWVRRLRKEVQAAIEEAVKPDPVMAAAVALAKSVQVLEGELEAAAKSLREGRIWVCVDTPARLKEAREAIAAARGAGVQL